METYKLLKFEFLMNSAACASSEESDECQTKKKTAKPSFIIFSFASPFSF
jgi:hypothetical protein